MSFTRRALVLVILMGLSPSVRAGTHCASVRKAGDAANLVKCLEAVLLFQPAPAVRAEAAREYLELGPLRSFGGGRFIEQFAEVVSGGTVPSDLAVGAATALASVAETDRALTAYQLLTVLLAAQSVRETLPRDLSSGHDFDLLLRYFVTAVAVSAEAPAFLTPDERDMALHYLTVAPRAVPRYAAALLAVRLLAVFNAVRSMNAEAPAETVRVFGDAFGTGFGDRELQNFRVLAQLVEEGAEQDRTTRQTAEKLANLIIYACSTFGRNPVECLRPIERPTLVHASSPFRALAYMYFETSLVAKAKIDFDARESEVQRQARVRELGRDMTPEEETSFLSGQRDQYVGRVLTPLASRFADYEASVGSPEQVEAGVSALLIQAGVRAYEGDAPGVREAIRTLLLRVGGVAGFRRLVEEERVYYAPGSMVQLIRHGGGAMGLAPDERDMFRQAAPILRVTFDVARSEEGDDLEFLRRLPPAIENRDAARLGSLDSFAGARVPRTYASALALLAGVAKELANAHKNGSASGLVRTVLLEIGHRLTSPTCTEADGEVLSAGLSDGLAAVERNHESLVACWRGQTCDRESLTEVVLSGGSMELRGPLTAELATLFPRPCRASQSFAPFETPTCQLVYLARGESKVDVYLPAVRQTRPDALKTQPDTGRVVCTLGGAGNAIQCI